VSKEQWDDYRKKYPTDRSITDGTRRLSESLKLDPPLTRQSYLRARKKYTR
jgi:hypothetical protein